jgi:predicted HicB family RNase H-like nuclease
VEYNGYRAVVTFDDEIGILHGEVVDTRDVITFQGQSVDELKQAFRDSVDEYLKICAERGRAPDKPFSGRVALRMEPETHRAVVAAARANGKSLNSWIVAAIDRELTH